MNPFSLPNHTSKFEMFLFISITSALAKVLTFISADDQRMRKVELSCVV